MKAIFFDLDDTLVDAEGSVHVSATEALRLAAQRYSLEVGALLTRFLRALRASLGRHDLGRIPVRDLRTRCFAEVLEERGIDDFALCGLMAHGGVRRPPRSFRMWSRCWNDSTRLTRLGSSRTVWLSSMGGLSGAAGCPAS
jgi:hypothetical protein